MKFKSKDLVKIALGYWLSIPFYLFRIIPINNKRIVISNFWGKGYGDNCKPIAEELLRRNAGYDIVWIINMPDKSVPSSIRQVKIHSLRSIFELTTAKLWIDNSRKPLYVRKRNGQVYINTWHGTAGFKKTGVANQSRASFSGHLTAMHDTKLVDIYLANSKFRKQTYRESFLYRGKILNIGSPRNDVLVNCKSADTRIKDKFGIGSDVGVILYAPTFRKNGRMDVYDLDFKAILSAFKDKFNKKFVMLVRLHPNMAGKADALQYSKNVINASNVPDISDILLETDVLITDYSSISFDYILLNRPVFIYAKDIDEYANGNALFHRIRQLPFPVSENNQELIKSIKGFDSDCYIEALKNFMKDMEYVDDGHASEKVVDLIDKILDDQYRL